jgi:hypothetical protein
VRLEGLSKLKEFNDVIGNQIREVPACSIVPQPNTLPCNTEENENENGASPRESSKKGSAED